MNDHLSREQVLAARTYLRGFLTDARLGLIQSVIAQRTRAVTVVLENISHPHNASAVLRSCDCFGVQDVHIIEQDNTFETNRAIAMGAGQWVSTRTYRGSAETPDATIQCLHALKQQGYAIVATTLREDSVPIDEVALDRKLAFCYGEEGFGLSETAHDLADLHVQIPMVGFTQSFNISVTVALTLYEVSTRLRQEPAETWQLSAEEHERVELEMLAHSVRGGNLMLTRFLAEQGWLTQA